MRSKILLAIFGAVFLALVLYFAMAQQRFYNWSETYDVKGNNPYDMKVMFDLLEQRFELTNMQERLNKTLPTKQAKAAGLTYLYIGQKPVYTEEEAWHLRDFVKAGGEAFIFSSEIQDSLAEILFYPEDCGMQSTWNGRNRTTYQENIYAYFMHPELSKHLYGFQYSFNHIPQQRPWAYVPEQAFCNSEKREFPIAQLGAFTNRNTNENYVNFFRVKAGAGYFYFHTNPIFFSNKYLVDSVGFEYASFVFSHSKNSTLYWDRESIQYPQASNQNKRRRPSVSAQSPLEYIFSQAPLRWSWFLFIALSATYVLLGAKRRQRAIPVLESNRNTSLEFIETIGRLYFQTQDHKGILKKQMHLFLAHLRQRYNLVTRTLDEQLIKRVSTRSNIDQSIIRDIFNAYEKLKPTLHQPYSKISAEQLNSFYLLIERFHKEVEKNKFRTKER